MSVVVSIVPGSPSALVSTLDLPRSIDPSTLTLVLSLSALQGITVIFEAAKALSALSSQSSLITGVAELSTPIASPFQAPTERESEAIPPSIISTSISEVMCSDFHRRASICSRF